jgi:hypothetical protein
MIFFGSYDHTIETFITVFGFDSYSLISQLALSVSNYGDLYYLIFTAVVSRMI